MEVLKKVKESPDVTSFYFGHADGIALADDFKPGQYITLRIPKDASGLRHLELEHDITRNYSLSCYKRTFNL